MCGFEHLLKIGLTYISDYNYGVSKLDPQPMNSSALIIFRWRNYLQECTLVPGDAQFSYGVVSAHWARADMFFTTCHASMAQSWYYYATQEHWILRFLSTWCRKSCYFEWGRSFQSIVFVKPFRWYVLYSTFLAKESWYVYKQLNMMQSCMTRYSHTKTGQRTIRLSPRSLWAPIQFFIIMNIIVVIVLETQLMKAAEQ